MPEKVSRRDVLAQSAALGVLTLGVLACHKEKVLICTDTSSLAPADLQLRTSPAVAYTEPAADPSKPCERCQHFLPSPSPDVCGACKVVKGPIHPKGGCKLFVAKPA